MNLQNLNLVELDAQEMRETEGGWLGALIVCVVVVVIIAAINADRTSE